MSGSSTKSTSGLSSKMRLQLLPSASQFVTDAVTPKNIFNPTCFTVTRLIQIMREPERRRRNKEQSHLCTTGSRRVASVTGEYLKVTMPSYSNFQNSKCSKEHSELNLHKNDSFPFGEETIRKCQERRHSETFVMLPLNILGSPTE